MVALSSYAATTAFRSAFSIGRRILWWPSIGPVSTMNLPKPTERSGGLGGVRRTSRLTSTFSRRGSLWKWQESAWFFRLILRNELRRSPECSQYTANRPRMREDFLHQRIRQRTAISKPEACMSSQRNTRTGSWLNLSDLASMRGLCYPNSTGSLRGSVTPKCCDQELDRNVMPAIR